MSAPRQGKVYYLAGPMTYYPQFNYPAFFKAAGLLRGNGYEIISPAEQDDAETLKEIMASDDGMLNRNLPSWGEFLSHDVKLVADQVDGIICLDNWWESRGACVEAFIATLCGKPVYKYDFYHKDLMTLIEPEAIAHATGQKLLAIAKAA